MWLDLRAGPEVEEDRKISYFHQESSTYPSAFQPVTTKIFNSF
jgi:hypothetical protein